MSNRFFLLTQLVAASFSAALASADSISIEVDAPFEPVSAVGLIVTETATIQRTEATFSRGKDDRIVVSFPFRDSEAKNGATATALIIAEDGTMAFGEMKPFESPEQRMVPSELPDCPAEKIKTVGLESQLGLLQKLLDVRTARRASMQDQIKEILTPEFRSKLAKLEKGFGLSRSSPLSLDLPPLELSDRLNRIIAALNDFRGAKKRAEEAESAQAEAAAQAANAAEAAAPAEDAPAAGEEQAESVPPNLSEEALAGN